MADEEVLAKKGPELFRELLRVYPVAEVDDYFKAGQWKDELMRVDLQLVEAHRREAGAPDPPALEEVVMPELPKTGVMMGGIMLPGGVRPPVSGIVTPGGVRPPGVLSATTIKPPGAVAAVAPAKAAAGAVAGNPVAELRLIALFVAKWKLDPTRTKMMLAKLTPQRRRYIIQNFKTAAQGVEATNALEQYITQCEKTNAWGAATATTPTTVAAVRPPGTAGTALRPAAGGVRPMTAPAAMTATAGVKRPLTPTNPALDPSKRPRMISAQTIAPKVAPAQTPAAAALAARLAATRPRAPGTVAPLRPGGATIRPPTMSAGGITPRPVTPSGGRPMGVVVAKPKAGEKPGELIRNLLQRF